MIPVTPQLALIVFMAILLTSAILAWYFSNYKDFDDGKFHTFTAILAGLGVFVTFMFYYGVVNLQQQQQKLFVIQETARLSTTVADGLLGEINQASAIIPNFAFSLTPLINCNESSVSDPETPVACMEKMVLSYKIFSVWQDLIIAETFIDYDPIAYITNFLQRSNSSQLFSQWNIQKINFNHNTQDFGDLLFEYGLPITDQVPESYVNAAEKLIADPRYSKILDI